MTRAPSGTRTQYPTAPCRDMRRRTKSPPGLLRSMRSCHSASHFVFARSAAPCSKAGALALGRGRRGRVVDTADFVADAAKCSPRRGRAATRRRGVVASAPACGWPCHGGPRNGYLSRNEPLALGWDFDPSQSTFVPPGSDCPQICAGIVRDGRLALWLGLRRRRAVGAAEWGKTPSLRIIVPHGRRERQGGEPGQSWGPLGVPFLKSPMFRKMRLAS